MDQQRKNPQSIELQVFSKLNNVWRLLLLQVITSVILNQSRKIELIRVFSSFFDNKKPGISPRSFLIKYPSSEPRMSLPIGCH